MKKLSFLLALGLCAGLTLSACHTIFPELSDQIQQYVNVKSISLIAYSGVLKTRPEASDVCEQISAKLHEMAKENAMEAEAAFKKVATSIKSTDKKSKAAALLALATLFEEFDYVFEPVAEDTSGYGETLEQFALGIDDALDIFYSGLEPIPAETK